jgi:hypothetical protein
LICCPLREGAENVEILCCRLPAPLREKAKQPIVFIADSRYLAARLKTLCFSDG